MKSKRVLCMVLTALFVILAFGTGSVMAASGDAIQLTATTDANTDTTVKYHYHIFSREAVVFAEGDKLQYEVYLDSKSEGLGSIEIWVSGADPDCFRDIASWKDQNGVKGHPNADLTEFAYKKWYTRTLPVPASMDGATAIHWDFGIEKNSAGETYTVYYDNIKVLDKDGNVKATVYADGAPAFDENNGGPGYENVSAKQAAGPVAAAAASDSPKTGDVGLLSYGMFALASLSGLAVLRNKKK